MSPVATWSSEWHRPLAASLTWSSPGWGSSASSSVTSHVPGAERMIAPRVSTGTGNLLVALVEGPVSEHARPRMDAPHAMAPVTPAEESCNVHRYDGPRPASVAGQTGPMQRVVVVG